MISRSSFIAVTLWKMSKGVKPWSRSMISYASKVHSFFVIGSSLSSHFHSLVVLVFFFFVLSLSCWTLPFSWFVLFSSDIALTFYFFALSLIIELCFCFLVFLRWVTVGGGVGLDEWSEVRLVTTTAGDWLAVCWVATAGDRFEVRRMATAGDWSAVCWVATTGDWLAVHWLAREGDWLEVRWVAGAEFDSSWPKVSVSSSFG